MRNRTEPSHVVIIAEMADPSSIYCHDKIRSVMEEFGDEVSFFSILSLSDIERDADMLDRMIGVRKDVHGDVMVCNCSTRRMPEVLRKYRRWPAKVPARLLVESLDCIEEGMS